MLTGSKPVEATARVRQDEMPAVAKQCSAETYGADLLAAIDWALKPHEDERPQTVAAFRSALTGNTAPVAVQRPTVSVDAPTVLVKPSAPVTTSGLTGMAIDREQLKKVEAELARHIGPIAPVVIRNAAKTSATLEALCEMAGREINDEKVRAAFIAKFTAAEKSAPPSGRTGLAAAPSAEALESISRKFSPEALARAEKALAQHIGAIARVVVRRAAAKARDEAELYLLISDEIKDPVERKAFAKKAVSISTRL
jgi:serine/threonine-protein kinase